MLTITDNHVADYLEEGGLICPFCISYGIAVDGIFEADGPLIRRTMICFNCGAGWSAVYKLVNPEPIIGPAEDGIPSS